MIGFDPGELSWGHGSAVAVAYALRIGALDVSVRVGGHRRTHEPLAREVYRNAQGKALTSITSARGHKRRYPIRTSPLSSSATSTLVAAITTGLPLSCTGWLVDGSVTAYAQDVAVDSEPASNGLSTVSFVLVEQ
jgi:hypothetical protein